MPVAGENFQRYKVLSLIGSGGMGEVYLVRDGQLGRNVALKVLKPNLSHKHSDALERFMLEARSASALNHPNIITIYEIGEAEGSHYIASEFVDGKTLHERINRRSLSLIEILNIAVQIGEALAAAHSAGIVHRDVKPENIMVRDDGYVKVLDFGLAKLTEYEMQAADVDADTLVATSPGIVMGTVSYMSPEQARGKTIDQRTDIWSLGVVLYEMLTGERPFRGETTSDTVAAILRSEPEPISPRFPETPLDLERIVAKALRKNFDERYQTIRDMLVDLRELRRELDLQMRSGTASFGLTRLDRPAISTGNGNLTIESTWPVASRTNSLSSAIITQFKLHPILLTAIIIVALGGIAAASWAVVRAVSRPSTPGFESMRFSKLTSIGTLEGGQIAVSPEGKYFAYVADDSDGESLWVRQTAAPSAIKLLPASNASYSGLTFSKDGSYLYYSYAERGGAPAIYKIPALGGEWRRLVTDAGGPISFSPRGDQFAFVRNESALMIAKEDGSETRALATISDGDAWWLPTWSPDGKRIVSGVYTPKNNTVRLVEVSIDTGRVSDLATPAWLRLSGLSWLPDGSGLLVSGRDAETQFSQVWKLDYPGGTLTRVTNDVQSYDGLSLTADGKSAVSVQVNRLANIWVGDESDPSSAKQITTETNRDEGLSGIAWAPDGSLIYTTRLGAFQDLWSVDRSGNDNRQLTFNAKSNFSPTVSPDGRYLAFVSTRSGDPNIWRSDRDGSEPVQLTNDPGIEGQPVFSPDGKTIFYHLEDANNKTTIWKVSIDGGTPERLTDFESSRPIVSPDGKLVAFRYGSASNGDALKVGMIDLDKRGSIRKLDFANVAQASYFRWSSDGRSLVYIDKSAGSSKLYSQPVLGGSPKLLAEFKGKRIYAFDISTRGSIALALGSETSEGLMISNFR